MLSHNNVTESFKNPDLQVKIHRGELQMDRNYLQRTLF